MHLMCLSVLCQVVLVNGNNHSWEPSQAGNPVTASLLAGSSNAGGNRHLDLGALVASGSKTGAGDVHVACHWGETVKTAVRWEF